MTKENLEERKAELKADSAILNKDEIARIDVALAIIQRRDEAQKRARVEAEKAAKAFAKAGPEAEE